jgi:type II secretory pathway predicted ATPase ExeA
MKSGSGRDENHVKLFGWNTNPFNFRILPDLFVGYSDEIDKITGVIKSNEKFSLLLGPTGSGKTTLMKHITKKFGRTHNIIYLPKPPKDPKDLTTIFMNFTRPGIIERLFSRSRKINLYNLSEYVNRKMKKNSIIMLVDEGHESSVEALEWLRTITDQVDNLSVMLAGLPVLDSMLKENLETFTCRVNARIHLSNLTRSETRELIKKRIEWAGGDDVKPFTSEAIEYIYDKTGGFPREVIKLCNELVQKAVKKNITTIDANFMREDAEPAAAAKRVSLSSMDELPDRQKEILYLLGKHTEMTPSEIVSRIDSDEYKDKSNAIRSVNNILKRLLKEGLIARKGKGRSYKYMLSEKTRTLMVNA